MKETIKKLENIIHRDHNNITGIIAQKNGIRLYESYFHGYQPEDYLHVYSVTKSVFSALFGIAMDQGYIKSVDQKVLAFFPDYQAPQGEVTAQHITLGDMLAMTAPYKCETEPYEAFFMSWNWLEFALDLLGGNGQIGDFWYSGIVGTHILSGILVKATGMPLRQFAMANLFQPLGICVPKDVTLRTKEEHMAVMNSKNTCGWAVDPQGVNPAGWGLFLTPGDMVKIGQLYLNGGTWNGVQIIPVGWIKESTKQQSYWQAKALPYGYLWWVIDKNQQAYAAMGDGGNVIYVNTAKKTVIAIGAFFTPDAGERIAFIRKHIEPAFED